MDENMTVILMAAEKHNGNVVYDDAQVSGCAQQRFSSLYKNSFFHVWVNAAQDMVFAWLEECVGKSVVLF